MIIDDKRTEAERESTKWWVIATDAFFSGWGLAEGGASYFAVACPNLKVVEAVESRMRQRREFKRVRIAGRNWKPSPRYCAHASLRGPTQARAFYEGPTP